MVAGSVGRSSGCGLGAACNREPAMAQESGGKGAEGSNAMEFHCNFPLTSGRPCGCLLTEGWLTSCGHVLCCEHGREWFAMNVGCPVCNCEQAVRVIKVNFRRKDANLLALGFTPREVLEAAAHAFDFWSAQKTLERTWQQEDLQQLVRRDARLRQIYEKRAAEAVGAMRSLGGRCEALRRRFAEMQRCREGREAEAEAYRARLRRIKRSMAALHAAQDSLDDIAPPPEPIRLRPLPTALRPRLQVGSGREELLPSERSSLCGQPSTKSPPPQPRALQAAPPPPFEETPERVRGRCGVAGTGRAVGLRSVTPPDPVRSQAQRRHHRLDLCEGPFAVAGKRDRPQLDDACAGEVRQMRRRMF
eukprot:TRINITY_DN46779_c0_g1_i1.p1 TRINITY_DN46779_c0_g1~~TRINITY_DN46779_c0_g1_i1.p1  ORF type:complete len:361 (-),score=67.60 TRINITY_DN46779_c0_g1_i1:195-1277(-)